MHWMAEKAAIFLIKHGAPEDEREVYVYVLETMLSVACMIVGFIVLGLLTGQLWIIAIWQVSLLSLRMPMGGYHATSHLRCQLMSFSFAILCLLLIPHVPAAICIALSVATAVIAWIIAPVVHVDQPQSPKERARARVFALLIAAAELLAVCLLCGLGAPGWIAATIATGGACASFPALYAHIRAAVAQRVRA